MSSKQKNSRAIEPRPTYARWQLAPSNGRIIHTFAALIVSKTGKLLLSQAFQDVHAAIDCSQCSANL